MCLHISQTGDTIIDLENIDLEKVSLPNTFINYKTDSPSRQWKLIARILKEKGYIVIKEQFNHKVDHE